MSAPSVANPEVRRIIEGHPRNRNEGDVASFANAQHLRRTSPHAVVFDIFAPHNVTLARSFSIVFRFLAKASHLKTAFQMFRKPTVLVLGAGASIPYGFPSGRDLIANLLTPMESESDTSKKCRREAGFDDDLHRRFREALTHTRPPSIDMFLEWRPEFSEIGKFLIAQRIAACENQHKLFPPTSRDHDAATSKDDWYPQLLNVVAPTVTSLGRNQLKIVTFNYDRSLEQFLYIALRERFQLTDSQINELLTEHIPILHVHGQLEPLPYQQASNGSTIYGAAITADRIKNAASRIKIIHEAADDAVEFEKAKYALSSASHVFFFGFGYHDLNLKRIGFPMAEVGAPVTLGTNFGLTDAESRQIRDRYKISTLSNQFGIGNFMRNSVDFLGIAN